MSHQIDPKWVQGSLLSPKDCKPGDLGGIAFSDDDVLIVISQSCDVICDSFEAEPHVDVHVGRSVDSIEGQYSHRKHPRVIDLQEDVEGQKRSFRCADRERLRIPRRRLSKALPAGQLSPKNASMLAKWTGARYTRPALPDEFNHRLKSSLEKISKLAKKNGEFLSGIYIGFANESELPGDQPYEIFLLGSIEPEIAEGHGFLRAMTCFESIRDAINSIDGIEVLEAELRTEDNISLYELNHMHRMSFDYLSERGGEPTPPL